MSKDLEERLLDVKGLSTSYADHWGDPGAWRLLLPKDPEVRALTERLLDDWDGTLREAIAAAEVLRAA